MTMPACADGHTCCGHEEKCEGNLADDERVEATLAGLASDSTQARLHGMGKVGAREAKSWR